MTTRQEVIDFCKKFELAYEDYPFDDPNWTVMRRRDTTRGFAWIFERFGKIWVNVKADPLWGLDLRDMYPSVLPAYHMNKLHWNSIVLDGTVPDEEIELMIEASYELCGKKSSKKFTL